MQKIRWRLDRLKKKEPPSKVVYSEEINQPCWLALRIHSHCLIDTKEQFKRLPAFFEKWDDTSLHFNVWGQLFFWNAFIWLMTNKIVLDCWYWSIIWHLGRAPIIPVCMYLLGYCGAEVSTIHLHCVQYILLPIEFYPCIANTKACWGMMTTARNRWRWKYGSVYWNVLPSMEVCETRETTIHYLIAIWRVIRGQYPSAVTEQDLEDLSLIRFYSMLFGGKAIKQLVLCFWWAWWLSCKKRR